MSDGATNTTVIDWVQGETASRDFRLGEDGNYFDLTGLTVTMEVFDKDGLPMDTTGDLVVILPQTGTDKGRVRFTPDPTDFVPAVDEPYDVRKISPTIGNFVYWYRRARCKIVDGVGGIGYFPRGDPNIWKIRKVQG
jgi:hypothetical protein